MQAATCVRALTLGYTRANSVPFSIATQDEDGLLIVDA